MLMWALARSDSAMDTGSQPLSLRASTRDALWISDTSAKQSRQQGPILRQLRGNSFLFVPVGGTAAPIRSAAQIHLGCSLAVTRRAGNAGPGLGDTGTGVRMSDDDFLS